MIENTHEEDRMKKGTLDIRKLYHLVSELYELDKHMSQLPPAESRKHKFRRTWLISLVKDLCEKPVALS